MNNPIVYTPEQVAKMLQLSKARIYQLIDSGELAAKKIGRVYRIPAEAVQRVTGMDEVSVHKPRMSKEAWRKRLLEIKGDWIDPEEIAENRRQIEERLKKNQL